MTPAEKKGLKQGQWVWFIGDEERGRPAQWLQLKWDDRTIAPYFTPRIGLGLEHLWCHDLYQFDWSRGIHDENPATAKLRHGDKVRVCVERKEEDASKRPFLLPEMLCMNNEVYNVGRVTKGGYYILNNQPYSWHRDWLELVERADKSTKEDNDMSNTITLTQEQKDALNRGESITIEPPKPEKWEPEGGPWWIGPIFGACKQGSGESGRRSGRERKRQDIAERDAKEGKLHDLLMAYRAQYAPDYVVPPIGQCACEISIGFDETVAVDLTAVRTLGAVYYPEWLAEQLQDDINSGRFDIGALRVPEED